MSDKIFTYRQVPHKAVLAHWMLNGVNFGSGSEIQKLDGWQKNADIGLNVELDFNVEEVNKCIRHDCGASFFITFYSRSDSDGTGVRGLVCKKKYDATTGSMSFEGVIPGDKVAGVIDLEVFLCIDEHKAGFGNNVSLAETVLAKDYGSMLFCEKREFILEGRQAQFPVAGIDFAKEGYNGRALYFLQRNKLANLETDFFSAYRLYINNTHPMFNTINGTITTGGDILSMLTFEIYQELILDALEDFHKGLFSMDDKGKKDSHTVKAMYINTLKTLQKHFDGLALEQIYNTINDRKSKEYSNFVCSLQSYLLDV